MADTDMLLRDFKRMSEFCDGGSARCSVAMLLVALSRLGQKNMDASLFSLLATTPVTRLHPSIDAMLFRGHMPLEKALGIFKDGQEAFRALVRLVKEFWGSDVYAKRSELYGDVLLHTVYEKCTLKTLFCSNSNPFWTARARLYVQTKYIPILGLLGVQSPQSAASSSWKSDVRRTLASFQCCVREQQKAFEACRATFQADVHRTFSDCWVQGRQWAEYWIDLRLVSVWKRVDLQFNTSALFPVCQFVREAFPVQKHTERASRLGKRGRDGAPAGGLGDAAPYSWLKKLRKLWHDINEADRIACPPDDEDNLSHALAIFVDLCWMYIPQEVGMDTAARQKYDNCVLPSVLLGDLLQMLRRVDPALAERLSQWQARMCSLGERIMGTYIHQYPRSTSMERLLVRLGRLHNELRAEWCQLTTLLSGKTQEIKQTRCNDPDLLQFIDKLADTNDTGTAVHVDASGVPDVCEVDMNEMHMANISLGVVRRCLSTGQALFSHFALEDTKTHIRCFPRQDLQELSRLCAHIFLGDTACLQTRCPSPFSDGCEVEVKTKLLADLRDKSRMQCITQVMKFVVRVGLYRGFLRQLVL